MKENQVATLPISSVLRQEVALPEFGRTELEEALSELNGTAFLCIQNHEGSRLIESRSLPLPLESVHFRQDERTLWDLAFISPSPSESADGCEFLLKFQLKKGAVEQVNCGLEIRFPQWSRSTFVYMPGAIYSGNRFISRAYDYCPLFQLPADQLPGSPVIISDIPRLNSDQGKSRIELLAGDMAYPAVGFFDQELRKGFVLLSGQRSNCGDYGFSIEEDEKTMSAVIRLTAPGIRHDTRYAITTTNHPSEDRGVNLEAGEEITVAGKLHVFPCATIVEFFAAMAHFRHEYYGETELRFGLPFSAAWEIQEQKYNASNWVESFGYYAVGMRENIDQNWQAGWTGGMIATYPLLAKGTTQSKTRVLHNIDFLFNGGQTQLGLFWSRGDGASWFPEASTDGSHFHLIRRSADVLFFLIKQLDWLKCSNGHGEIKPVWDEGARRCAESLVTIWKRYGELGHFVAQESGEILIGGSTSGALAAGALCLASAYFDEPEFGIVAQELAELYAVRDIQAGVTTGGPGDALQCPDSESVFSLLESYVTLYEHSGERRWLDHAKAAADQALSWIMPYDFAFPENSAFGKMDVRTAGSIFANAQNKHSAPGACTHSGHSLFRLFRYTGEVRFLRAIQQTARNITQYLSREDRPIPCSHHYLQPNEKCTHLPPGWMNERVNTSDWCEPVGEIFDGSCWCEVSAMLTYLEIPGVYVQTDTGLVCCFDHVQASLVGKTLRLFNPTAFNAEFTVFYENSIKAAFEHREPDHRSFKSVTIPAGESSSLEIFGN